MAAPTSIRDTRVKRFSPTGASDSLDATDEFPGACASLANLVPDLSTRNLWTVRPASTLYSGADFTLCPNITSHIPGPVEVFKVIGGFVFGLVQDASSDTCVPFAFNLATNTFVSVGGAGQTPSSYSPNFSLPPTIDLVGVKVVITHPHYTNAVGFIDISNLAAPVYSTSDLTGAITFAGLGASPSWVRQFNQRAYYGVNTPTKPSVVASDVLVPGNVTNAGQALTFGNNLTLTAAAPLGLSNQLGGIIQSLMVFQGVNNIQQVTGDFSLSTWAVNTLNVATGTLSPRSVVPTPLGLAFLSPAGLRFIDPNGTVSDPIGTAGTGITIPLNVFANTTTNGTSAGCDGVTLRISVFQGSTGAYEYWYNLARKVWSGPHGWNSTMFDTYNGQFVVSPNGNYPDPNHAGLFGTGLYNSPTDPSSGSTFVESFGYLNSFTMKSTMLEDNGQMAQSELSDMQLIAGSAASETLTITLLDSDGNTINTALPLIVNATGSKPAVRPYRVDFPASSVFNRMAISITGVPAPGIRLGDSWMRIKTLGYTISEQTPSS